MAGSTPGKAAGAELRPVQHAMHSSPLCRHAHSVKQCRDPQPKMRNKISIIQKAARTWRAHEGLREAACLTLLPGLACAKVGHQQPRRARTKRRGVKKDVVKLCIDVCVHVCQLGAHAERHMGADVVVSSRMVSSCAVICLGLGASVMWHMQNLCIAAAAQSLQASNTLLQCWKYTNAHTLISR